MVHANALQILTLSLQTIFVLSRMLICASFTKHSSMSNLRIMADILIDLNTLKCKCVQNYTSSKLVHMRWYQSSRKQYNLYCDDGNLNGVMVAVLLHAVELTSMFCSPAKQYHIVAL